MLIYATGSNVTEHDFSELFSAQEDQDGVLIISILGLSTLLLIAVLSLFACRYGARRYIEYRTTPNN